MGAVVGATVLRMLWYNPLAVSCTFCVTPAAAEETESTAGWPSVAEPSNPRDQDITEDLSEA